jgi:type I restriction enzyme R subunit
MTDLHQVHKENVFEKELVEYLGTHGWKEGSDTKYDKELALYPEDLLDFIKETQSTEWAKFVRWHNSHSDTVFLKRVAEQLDRHGTLFLLRHGFKDRDARFSLCQFRPAHDANPGLRTNYSANRLTVVRQLHYSRQNQNSLDLGLFVNGLPVATAELKTDLTQNVRDAIRQYQKDRLPRDSVAKENEPLLAFKTRALVHFAVSTDEVFITTRLEGAHTRFLPFNQGHDEGAGNPPNPHGYATSYLWEKIWQRDNWLDILGNFLTIEKKEEGSEGRGKIRESLIFPRYHQWEAVRLLVDAARKEGVGHSYLIQHSAGSGKSNTIGWVAHRMASLHNERGEKVFDSIVVITDRKVLDKQLQETIYQFEHKEGVVQKIDENSGQLAQALSEGKPIIITTLQKFPFVMEKVGDLSKRRFALIIDEAHSSQTGSAAQKLQAVLSSSEGEETDPEEELTSEDVVNRIMASRKRPENLSTFAFTATPKAKTLEIFGCPGPDGKPEPFHVYSMRQAIEEGFILDVLQHYVSYKAFYKLAHTGNEDKEFPVDKASKALGRFLRLHPHNIAQKVAIIIEHFREKVLPKIGGKAKAMVVTDSRKAAVRYKIAFDKYIAEHGYRDCRALVAFSGKVSDPESGSLEFSEANMNPDLRGQDIRDAFDTDDYRVLIVANKFQTGFDQPLLHSMYVDKRLAGVLAVQTLSRLNRIFPGKEDTFVLDFVNDLEEILEAFKPYFRTARLEERTDPNLIHELKIKLDGTHVYFWNEVERFAEAFFDPKRTQASLHPWLKPAADRYRELKEEEQVLFRKDLISFLRLYEFLSQIVPYNDLDLEKLYAFGRNLLPRLALKTDSEAIDISEDVRLTHFRLQKQGERKLSLEEGETPYLIPTSDVGTGVVRESETGKLSEIVRKMNDLFSGDLTDADLIGYATHTKEKLLENRKLEEQAKNNTFEQFILGDFDQEFMNTILENHDRNQKMSGQVLSDERVREGFRKLVRRWVYEEFGKRKSNGNTNYPSVG